MDDVTGDASESETVVTLQRPLLVAALLGFLLIGICAVGCVSFGISEIISKDAVFLNDGLGEVLTILGVYFTVPYLFCVATFLIIVVQPKCFQRVPEGAYATSLLILTMAVFVIQQVITNIYMDLLISRYTLVLIVLDVVVFVAYCYYRFHEAHATILYTILYAVKLAVQFPNAYETADQSFFGPNGVSVMLFLTIPLIQFPLYVMSTSSTEPIAGQPSSSADGIGATLPLTSYEDIDTSAAQLTSPREQQTPQLPAMLKRSKRRVKMDANRDLVTSFKANFNLYLSHLLHSLDIISMYSFAFTAPTASATMLEAPSQFRVMIIIVVVIAFLSNNISVLHLFYRRPKVEQAEIVFLPAKFREVSRSVDADEVGGSQRRRIFQYMLFMLVVCDVPMLLTRLELWRKQYATLSIFVAKNIKSVADAVIMVMRADTKDGPNGAANGSAPAAASTGGGVAASKSRPSTRANTVMQSTPSGQRFS